MKSCDVFPAVPESDGRGLYDHAWEAVRDGAVVYVTSTALPAFIRRAAPRIPGRYTLVTGDSDAWVPAFLVQDGLPGPGGGMEPGEVQAFIDSPALLHWYGARRPTRGARRASGPDSRVCTSAAASFARPHACAEPRACGQSRF